jgi:hypothetical protein
MEIQKNYSESIKQIIVLNTRIYNQIYNQGKEEIFAGLASRDLLIDVLKEQLIANQNNQTVTLENVDGLPTYNQDWNWVSKIIFILQHQQRPLRSAEMIELFLKFDDKIKCTNDKAGYFSAFLTKAYNNKRVVKLKVNGFKGFYYALPEWYTNGHLQPNYYAKINLFVGQVYN